MVPEWVVPTVKHKEGSVVLWGLLGVFSLQYYAQVRNLNTSTIVLKVNNLILCVRSCFIPVVYFSFLFIITIWWLYCTNNTRGWFICDLQCICVCVCVLAADDAVMASGRGRQKCESSLWTLCRPMQSFPQRLKVNIHFLERKWLNSLSLSLSFCLFLTLAHLPVTPNIGWPCEPRRCGPSRFY